MLGALFNKMTNEMLFFLVVPTAALICALSWLIFAYGIVVWKSDEVSYKGALGEITAKVSNVECSMRDALKFNEELIKTITLQQKFLNDLNNACMQNSLHAHMHGKEHPICSITSNFSENLKHQSDLLVNQKQKLDDINHDVVQVSEQLKSYRKSNKKP